jgi:hypothetical protein
MKVKGEVPLTCDGKKGLVMIHTALEAGIDMAKGMC